MVNIPEVTGRRTKRVKQFKYYQNNPKKMAIKNLTRKYKNKRQNSLLSIATGPSSRYYTTRQTDAQNRSIGKVFVSV